MADLARRPPEVNTYEVTADRKSAVSSFYNRSYFLAETMTATRTPKAIINDNASYVLMLSPPLPGKWEPTIDHLHKELYHIRQPF